MPDFSPRRFLTAIAIVTFSVPAFAEEIPVTENWSIDISPAVNQMPVPMMTPVAPASVNPGEVVSGSPIVDPADYKRIFRSIPFNRAEYNANPSYRHDATMEILTGIGRHQTIVKHTNYRPPRPAPPVATAPYRYNQAGSGLNYFFYWNPRRY
ncbi:MAG: hypothetical protein KDA91_15865 [Planctomycetaceae bacterium]|nr:hypothetical protein [Planctomycetaceae bacterium]